MPVLAAIKTFDQLLEYLQEELDWPVEDMEIEDLTFEYDPEELGLNADTAAKIKGGKIKQLRPLTDSQPFGIFFVEFEPKKLPVTALRRILGRLVTKKRASANPSDRRTWDQDDLIFASAYGEGDTRRIDFAHFARDAQNGLPTLRVLGWDADDTPLQLDWVEQRLKQNLLWPERETVKEWRIRWRDAFVLQHREAITTSKQLAVRLADLARDIRKRCNAAMKIETEKGPLRSLMRAFKEALIHDLKEDDFADMYAQTISYGLLSARVSRPAGMTASDLSDMVPPQTNPFLKELLETFLNVGGRKWSTDRGRITGIDFDELGINEVVDTLREANMEAVLRDFGNRNPTEDPVIHFYELFLKEYDAKKRLQRGVFYTPRPVVSYIVRSVHELLQTEFGLPDGLADTATWADMLKKHKDLKLPEIEVVDPKTHKVSRRPIEASTPFVQILDPATGTGTFLVEVIEVIYNHLRARWAKEGHGDLWIDKKWNEYVPRHLLPRLHGYELMMAPYAIAQMKLSLKLYATGYTFGSGERVRIYLTNALEPPQDFSDTFEQMAPALAHEAKAVNDVKRHQRFTVVIGNPPYAGHSLNNQVEWIVDKVHDYKRGYPELQKPGQAKWLQDDYVKFIRLAEHSVDSSAFGVLGYITNHSYLDNPTFKGMRRHLIETFSRLSLLDLHGNAKKKEKMPDGSPDDNVFDIQQGVAVILARRGSVLRSVDHQDLVGSRESKYAWLLTSSHQPRGASAIPTATDLCLFRPRDDALSGEYSSFLALDEWNL